MWVASSREIIWHQVAWDGLVLPEAVQVYLFYYYYLFAS